MASLWVLLAQLLLHSVLCISDFNFTFPKDFYFGTASSATQTEGAWNVDGKGPTIWDNFTHAHPDRIAGSANPDDAAKAYYKYKEDVKAAKDVGMQVYRFSISWSRILPTGLPNNINKKGIEHYNNVINEIVNNGMIPMVTMYHWDLPQNLQNLGGWTNEIITVYFEQYARILFENFGDRVKWWGTFNEPHFIALGYELNSFAPGLDTLGVGPYLAIHNVLKSHARAYHLYNECFRTKQKGKVTIFISFMDSLPLDPTSKKDNEAVHMYAHIQVGWFSNPVYSKNGDYPQLMKDHIKNLSLAQGFPESRLPAFTSEEVQYVRGTADFIGINVYTTLLVSKNEKLEKPSLVEDMGVKVFVSKNWIRSEVSSWEAIAPLSIRNALNWFRDEYGDQWELFITENGFADSGEINDTMRQNYYGTYLIEVLKAIHIDKCRVVGYLAWTLIDSFEWAYGYGTKFGLYKVDFNDPERRRTPKQSSYFMKQITESRQVPKQYLSLGEHYNDMIRNVSYRNSLERLYSTEDGKHL